MISLKVAVEEQDRKHQSPLLAVVCSREFAEDSDLLFKAKAAVDQAIKGGYPRPLSHFVDGEKHFFKGKESTRSLPLVNDVGSERWQEGNAYFIVHLARFLPHYGIINGRGYSQEDALELVQLLDDLEEVATSVEESAEVFLVCMNEAKNLITSHSYDDMEKMTLDDHTRVFAYDKRELLELKDSFPKDADLEENARN